jgi:predicted dehydrogenase
MKILICGLGSIGMRHLGNLRQLGHTDILLYRTGKSTLQDEAGLTLGLPVYDSIEAALDQGPKIAVISNPSSLHIDTALQCAEGGMRHVNRKASF